MVERSIGEFDQSKFAAEVLFQATELAVKSATSSSAVTKTRRLYQRVTDAFSPYLEKTYRRVSTIRTFLKPTESVELLSAYVPVDLDASGEEADVSSLLDWAHAGKSFVVTGLAGRGKSVLMRFMALSMYHAPRGKLPIFVELRSLNSLTSKEILPYIHAQYKSESNISYDDFVYALRQGYFLLLLDGFDEISPPDREDIEKQILNIADDYPECPIVVSGRYDDRFFSWEPFSCLTLKEMKLEQTKQLIERSQYDEKVKSNFLRRLTESFFQKHESFLNTPLLAIMLMRTFEEYAEIPHSLHEFYRNAFDTLVRRHDAMKSQFLRTTHSGCTAEEFKRVFSSFCVLTYSRSAFSFHREEALEYLRSALAQQEISADPQKVLDDLIESVCLLHEEGFEISFVHRSFQEYFCALFVASAPSGFVERFLEDGDIRVRDDVLPMLMGINQDRVEDEWATEFVEGVIKKYPKRDKSRHCRFLIDRLPKWAVQVGGETPFVALIEDTKLNKCVQITRRFYPEKFNESSPPRLLRDRDYRKRNNAQFSELLKLEEQGVTQLQGLRAESEKADESGAVRLFEFRVDESFCDFFGLVFEDGFDHLLKGFDAVQRVQQSRRRSGQAFVDELFVKP